jgi:hypothetical protein
MRQLLHLLVLDPERTAAMGQSHDRGWTLPIIACHEHARAPRIAQRWLSDRGLRGFVAGQWIGRVAADVRSVDWLVVLVVRDTAFPVPAPMSWLALGQLCSRPGLVEYQVDAVRRVTGRGLTVDGPFGSVVWVDQVLAWIRELLRTRNVVTIDCYRSSPREVVLGVSTHRGRVYFKGLAADRAREAACTILVSAGEPLKFPRTLACEHRPHSTWWLMEECSGTPLSRLMRGGDLVRAAADVASLQRTVVVNDALRRTLPLLDLEAIREAAEELSSRAGHSFAPGTFHCCLEQVNSLEKGWTPLDLDPVNVFLRESSVSYIDLDPWFAPMALAGSTLVRRCRRRLAPGPQTDLDGALRRALERGWGTPVPWTAVDVVSGAVEIIRGWQRLERSLRCGELEGPVERLAGIAASRLTAACEPAGQSMR